MGFGLRLKIRERSKYIYLKIDKSECLKYVYETVLDIVIIEIEQDRSKIQENPKFIQNEFWSKIENTRTIKILKSMNQKV